MFCPRHFTENDTDVLSHIQKCHEEFQEDDRLEEALDDETDEDDGRTLPTIRNYQAQDDISCIEVNNPEITVVLNTTKKPKQISVKDSITGKPVILAPGEGKIPTNIMRETDFDIKAFPLKHPTGRYGLDFNRAIRLSKKEYFRARLFHYSGIFANDNDYLFMSQQFMERAQLEGQIDIITQKGVMINGPDGIKSMKLSDAFSVFKKISGTPKFWQQKRNNLLAMINGLGPIQWFFTFSFAELRWP